MIPKNGSREEKDGKVARHYASLHSFFQHTSIKHPAKDKRP